MLVLPVPGVFVVGLPLHGTPVIPAIPRVPVVPRATDAGTEGTTRSLKRDREFRSNNGNE